MKDRIVVVFSGFNQRAVIAFLRTLKKKQVSFVIVASSANDSIFDSEYKKYIIEVRENLTLEIDSFFKIFERVKSKTKIDRLLIAPTTEALNRFLLENKEQFEKRKIIVPLVKYELYSKISDKYSFGQLCEYYGILVPKSTKNIDEISVPFVAKPYTYFSKDKKIYTPVLIYTEIDKLLFLKEYDTDSFYYQEFILGRSFYLLYYFDKLGNVYKYSQENIAQQADGKSILAAISSSIHKSEISDKYEHMLKELNFRGLIMIEVRECQGEYYMIEANPRFWGPSQLFVDSGINLFENFLYDYDVLENKPIKIIDTDKIRYFWHGGIVDSKNIVYHTNDYPINDDTLPQWLENDIYRRTDTINIFEKEVKK